MKKCSNRQNNFPLGVEVNSSSFELGLKYDLDQDLIEKFAWCLTFDFYVWSSSNVFKNTGWGNYRPEVERIVSEFRDVVMSIGDPYIYKKYELRIH